MSYNRFKPYGERKFDELMANSLGLDTKPKPKQMAKTDREVINPIPFLPDISTTDCFYSQHKVLGCSTLPSKPVYVVSWIDMVRSGIPQYPYCTEPVFYLPMCHTCALLFLHVHFNYRCKTSWTKMAMIREHMAMKSVNWWFIQNKERFRQVTQDKKQEAGSRLNTLLASVQTVEIRTLREWTNYPELEGKTISYVDLREFKEHGRITIRVWNSITSI